MDTSTLYELNQQRLRLQRMRDDLVEAGAPATTQEQVNRLQVENDAMRQEIEAIKSRIGDGAAAGKEVLRKAGQMRLL